MDLSRARVILMVLTIVLLESYQSEGHPSCVTNMRRSCTCYNHGVLRCRTEQITDIPRTTNFMQYRLRHMDLRGSCIKTVDAADIVQFPRLEILDLEDQCFGCVTLLNPELIYNHTDLEVRGLCQQVRYHYTH